MNKKWNRLVMAFLLVAAFMFAACETDEVMGVFDPDNPPAVLLSDYIIIDVDEFWELYQTGYENLVVIGVIDPLRGVIPFTVASNPVRDSYLVWTPDYMRTGGDEAISDVVTNSRRSRAEMELLLSRANITEDSFIVVYASDSMAQGARVVWHLYALGFNVRWLDGGGAAWNDADLPTGRSVRMNDQDPVAELTTPRSVTEIGGDIHTVIEAAQNPDEWLIIDVRNIGEFEGTQSMGGSFGTGRIAGAVHIEWIDAFIPDTDLLRPIEELKEIYAEALDGRRVIVYCQGGVRSAFTWMVLHDLGVHVYNYDGSWAEWSYAASVAGSFPYQEIVAGLTEEWTDNEEAF